MAKTKKAEEEKPILTELQKVEGITNDEKFNLDEFTLKGKTFKIKHLGYDDFVVFTSYFEPMVRKVLASMNTTNQNETVSLANVDIIELIKTCGDNLPLMGQMILKQTNPSITIEETKELCEDPFTICELVLLQMNKNRMVEKFSTFFPQLMSLIRL